MKGTWLIQLGANLPGTVTDHNYRMIIHLSSDRALSECVLSTQLISSGTGKQTLRCHQVSSTSRSCGLVTFVSEGHSLSDCTHILELG